MKRLLLLAVAAVVALTSTGAAADVLRATRQQPLRETAHRVEVSIQKGIATYRVRRTFFNPGKMAEEARLDIHLPHGAVATGLRIKARQRWYDGELMHRDKAEELYRELTGQGPSEPKDPALLYWRWTDRLTLRVFPVLPGRSSVVEYTLTAPTHYRDGVHTLTYARRPSAPNLAAPVVTVRGANVRAVTVDGKAAGRRLSLAPVKVPAVLTKAGIQETHALARGLTVPTSTATSALRVGVDIRHTWAGDVELRLIDPSGQVHSLQGYDLSRRGNDLRATFDVAWSGDLRGRWHLVVTDHHPLDGGTVRSWFIEPIPHDAPATFRSPRRVTDRSPAAIPQPTRGSTGIATLGLRLRESAATHVRLGRVALVAQHQFSRVEIDVARRLSSLPRGQHVVFVVDASHTMGSDGIEAQLRLARAYLSHLPRSRFALIGYGHEAEVWSDFVPAGRFAAVVKALRKAGRLEPRNGSFLDRGIAEAARLLQGKQGSTAVVAMTDDRLRPLWHQRLALPSVKQLAKDAVLHAVEVGGGAEPGVLRKDQHRLFPLARTRGGIAAEVSGSQHGKWSVLRHKVRYLVRPDRLDHPKISGLKSDMVLSDLDAGAGVPALREGEAVRWMSEVPAAPRQVALSGQLWSRPVTVASEGDEPFHRATAGYVFSLDHYSKLNETEQYVIATYGRAVSPVTSYLAIEPGVRPSRIGLEPRLSGVGMGGGGAAFGASFGRLSRRPIDWTALRRAVVRQCSRVRQGSERVTVYVDTNGDEIADVRPKEPSLSAFGRCVVSAIWRYRLHTTEDVDLTQLVEI